MFSNFEIGLLKTNKASAIFFSNPHLFLGQHRPPPRDGEDDSGIFGLLDFWTLSLWTVFLDLFTSGLLEFGFLDFWTWDV